MRRAGACAGCPGCAGSPRGRRRARRKGGGQGAPGGRAALRPPHPSAWTPPARRGECGGGVQRRPPARTDPARVGRMAATPSPSCAARPDSWRTTSPAPRHRDRRQMCGDAHAANFGLYRRARAAASSSTSTTSTRPRTDPGSGTSNARRLPGARRPGGGRRRGHHAPRRGTAGAYRRTMRLLAKRPRSTRRNVPSRTRNSSPHTDAHDLLGTPPGGFRRKGPRQHQRPVRREVDRGGAGRRTPVRARPPCCAAHRTPRAAVAAALEPYVDTLGEDRRAPCSPGAVHDVAFRVVGTGSVGARSYVVLLLDHRGEPLVLQVKEARPAALVPHLATAGFRCRGAARRAPGDPRAEADAGRQRHPARLDHRRGAPLPGAPVPQPQGQRRPGRPRRRPDRRLRPYDRRPAGPRPLHGADPG